MYNIGEIIRKNRLHLHMSQSEVANMAGIHRVALSKIERGVNEPSWSTSIRILSAVNLNVKIE